MCHLWIIARMTLRFVQDEESLAYAADAPPLVTGVPSNFISFCLFHFCYPHLHRLLARRFTICVEPGFQPRYREFIGEHAQLILAHVGHFFVGLSLESSSVMSTIAAGDRSVRIAAARASMDRASRAR